VLMLVIVLLLDGEAITSRIKSTSRRINTPVAQLVE
jgi:hypothetical protein